MSSVCSQMRIFFRKLRIAGSFVGVDGAVLRRDLFPKEPERVLYLLYKNMFKELRSPLTTLPSSTLHLTSKEVFNNHTHKNDLFGIVPVYPPVEWGITVKCSLVVNLVWVRPALPIYYHEGTKDLITLWNQYYCNYQVEEKYFYNQWRFTQIYAHMAHLQDGDLNATWVLIINLSQIPTRKC